MDESVARTRAGRLFGRMKLFSLITQLRRLAAIAVLAAAAAFGQAIAVPSNYFDPDIVRAQVVASVKLQIQKQNEQALALYVSAAQAWETNAKRNQELGIPLPAKPAVPRALEVVPRPTTDANMLPIDVVLGGPLAPEVPDIAPLPPKPAGVVVAIGVRLYGSYFQAKPEDTAPDGYEAAVDGKRYRKVMGPFGGWWLQL